MRVRLFFAIWIALATVAFPLRASADGVTWAPVEPASAQASSEQQLVDRFAPIAFLREQNDACDRKGEAYFPAPVETVLGNPEVALMQRNADESQPDTIVMMAPTAQDLAGLDDTYYLDFPGDPRHPDCTYEEHFKRYVTERGLQPTAYARIVIDENAGQLVLQYWLFYYFNDWNNTHESDWELVQLVFNTTSVDEALAGVPAYVGYAQHGGGELAEWDDPKLFREGDHIAVYPGAGSHGTFYSEETFIGWGENGTGFGCDLTYAPTVRTPLTAVLIPNDVAADSPFAWTTFGGRWGEKEDWEYNGPTGPNLTAKWETPLQAMEDWRTSSLKVPGGRETIGPTSTDLFCNLSAAGSRVLMELGTRPWLLLSLILVLVGGFITLFVLKRQEIAAALRMYRRYARIFVIIGLFTIPIGIAFNGFQILLRENPPVEWVVKWFNDTASARLTAAAIAGGFQQLTMVLLISPPVIQAMHDITQGRAPSVRRSFTVGYRYILPIAAALFLITVSLVVLVLVLIGIPIAIWLAVRWQFFGQAAILDDITRGQEAMAQSRRIVKGRWWHALGDSLVFQLIAIIPGPLLGAILMLAGKASVTWVNTFSSIVYALTVPISVIGLTQAYLRYRDRSEAIPAPAVRRVDPVPPPHSDDAAAPGTVNA